jgi:hypothetical protein
MGAVMEQMAIITSKLDVQAAHTHQLMQRDDLRDHHAPIVVDQPLLLPRPPHAPPLFPHGPTRHPTVSAPPVGPTARRGRRPTIDHVVLGRAAREAADFDRDSINISMKMNVLMMGPHTQFRHWKNKFCRLLKLRTLSAN